MIEIYCRDSSEQSTCADSCLAQQIQAVQSMEKEKTEAKADAVQKANAVVTAYQNMGGQIGACEGGSITVANGSTDFKQGDTKEGDCSCVMM